MIPLALPLRYGHVCAKGGEGTCYKPVQTTSCFFTTHDFTVTVAQPSSSASPALNYWELRANTCWISKAKCTAKFNLRTFQSTGASIRTFTVKMFLDRFSPHLKRSAGGIKHGIRQVSTSLPIFTRLVYPFQKFGRAHKNGVHVTATLDPNKFAEKKQQRFHNGNLQSFRPRIFLLKQSSPVTASRIYYDLTLKTVTGKLASLPTRHESIFILLHGKTPHRGRTTPPSHIK